MITEDQLKEIKKYLDSSENPLFFYDDDNDGLCSYLLLRKYLGKGKGICVRGKPMLSSEFLRYVKENMPDKIFVLDKPIIDQDFIDNVNVPIIWIDHHTPIEREGVKYFNPRIENEKDRRNVAYWCYKVILLENKNGSNGLWIASVGCISDWFLPEFYNDLRKKYKDLFNNEETPEDVLFKSKFGELCRIINFLLKGKVSDVNKSVRLLLRVKDPYEILNGDSKEAKYILRRIGPIKKEYENLLKEALKFESKEKIYFFRYRAHKYSLTSELANELIYRFPNKIIVVGREKDNRIKMSLRSSKIDLRPVIQKALIGVDGYGGGHEFAGAVNINVNDFDRFIENFRRYIS